MTLHEWCQYCCFKRRTEDKKLNGCWLRVKHAVDPQLILWANYGISPSQLVLRRMLYYLFQIAILVGSYFVVLSLELR